MVEDILMLNFLKGRGIIDEHLYSELTSKMSKPHKEEVKHTHDTDIYSDFFDSFKEVTKQMNETERTSFINRLKEYNAKPKDHFDENHAKYIVSKMWHLMPTGEKCMGEIYDMLRAKEVHDRYKGMVPHETTCADVYIAINALYHDYSLLFKRWFGGDIDAHIIESAMTFWFEDDDAKSTKLWKYFEDI